MQIIEARLQGEYDVKLLEAKAVFDKNLQNEKQRYFYFIFSINLLKLHFENSSEVYFSILSFENDFFRFDALLQKELEKTKNLQEEFEKQKAETEIEKQNSAKVRVLGIFWERPF